VSTQFPRRLASLLSPGAYPHPVERVELIETHVSWVLLTGEYAYKLKRPVHFPFIDLRAPERRQFFCEEELRLNMRFAPDIYLGICEVTEDDSGAQIGGRGKTIEYAVRMRQFRRADELDRLLAAGDIEPRELREFGRALATIHAGLPAASSKGTFGQPAGVQALLLENLQQTAQITTAVNACNRVQALRAPLTACLRALQGSIAARLAGRCVRECHGDLHVLNIVRRDSRLLAFDCLEFDPAFRWIDIADEIAFLVMDLEARGFQHHSNAFLNGYLMQSGDYAACRMLPLYQSHRALIRAKVTALTIAQDLAKDAPAARALCEAYLDAAERVLKPRRPTLVLMCGLSGSGKTWLAHRLAPRLHAVHLRSDIERKRLRGLATDARSNSPLGGGLYSGEQNALTYTRLTEFAADVLSGGYAVIVDATCNRRADRMRFCDLARSLGVELRVIHSHAPPEVLRARIAARKRAAHDASEADLSVLAWQEAHEEAINPEEGLDVIEIDTTAPQPEAQVERVLRKKGFD